MKDGSSKLVQLFIVLFYNDVPVFLKIVFAFLFVIKNKTALANEFTKPNVTESDVLNSSIDFPLSFSLLRMLLRK